MNRMREKITANDRDGTPSPTPSREEKRNRGKGETVVKRVSCCNKVQRNFPITSLLVQLIHVSEIFRQ